MIRCTSNTENPMPGLLCYRCRHLLSGHQQQKNQPVTCRVPGCKCSPSLPVLPPQLPPNTPVEGREAYLKGIETSLRRSLEHEGPARAIDYMRASWDAGYLFRERAADSLQPTPALAPVLRIGKNQSLTGPDRLKFLPNQKFRRSHVASTRASRTAG